MKMVYQNGDVESCWRRLKEVSQFLKIPEKNLIGYSREGIIEAKKDGRSYLLNLDEEAMVKISARNYGNRHSYILRQSAPGGRKRQRISGKKLL